MEWKPLGKGISVGKTSSPFSTQAMMGGGGGGGGMSRSGFHNRQIAKRSAFKQATQQAPPTNYKIHNDAKERYKAQQSHLRRMKRVQAGGEIN